MLDDELLDQLRVACRRGDVGLAHTFIRNACAVKFCAVGAGGRAGRGSAGRSTGNHEEPVAADPSAGRRSGMVAWGWLGDEAVMFAVRSGPAKLSGGRCCSRGSHEDKSLASSAPGLAFGFRFCAAFRISLSKSSE
jgi:hypothetical protein